MDPFPSNFMDTPEMALFKKYPNSIFSILFIGISLVEKNEVTMSLSFSRSMLLMNGQTLNK
jgi:hypothetical protein